MHDLLTQITTFEGLRIEIGFELLDNDQKNYKSGAGCIDEHAFMKHFNRYLKEEWKKEHTKYKYRLIKKYEFFQQGDKIKIYGKWKDIPEEWYGKQLTKHIEPPCIRKEIN